MASLNKRLPSESALGDRKAEMGRNADIVFLDLQTAAFVPSGRSQIDTGTSDAGSQAAFAAADNKCRILTIRL